jgi:diguanylate cyclase (GGDEF)-like protein
MNNLSVNDRAQLVRDATVQFWQHIIPIVQIAFGIHVVLFALFTVLGLSLLAVGNALSIGVYVVCLKAIRAGNLSAAGMLMSVEIILHALLATWVLGWESNFHFYLYCLVPIIAFSFQHAPKRRVMLNLAIILVAAGTYAARSKMGVGSGIAPRLLEIFGVINVLTAAALLLHCTALSVRFTYSMQLGLFHTANLDSLTNLYTRRRVMRRVSQLTDGSNAAVILLDIDRFKQINDSLGHERGDVILQRVAQAIRANVRATDVASRWGGEEFLVLMPETPEQEARAVADRILKRIGEWAGQLESDPIKVTATLAVTVIRHDESFEDALNRADQALYQGKEQGRNRVMVAPSN